MKAKTTPDPIFTAYAASAPLLDLQFYLDYAGRHLPEYGPATLECVMQMIRLRDALKGSPASQKRQVWAAIAAFKSSAAQPVFDEAGFWAMHGRPVTNAAYNGLTDSRKVAA